MLVRSAAVKRVPKPTFTSTASFHLSHQPCIEVRHTNALPGRQITHPLPRIPKPTPFVPDVATFLKLIGRNLSQHSEKISSWDDMFSLTSEQFSNLGIEPTRSRRYLLDWLDRFRRGKYGVGGDAQFVAKDGSVEVRLVDIEMSPEEAERRGTRVAKATLNTSPNTIRRVVNVPSTAPEAVEPTQQDQAQDTEAKSESSSAEENTDAAAVSPDAVQVSRLPPLDNAFLKEAPTLEGISYRPGRGIRGSYVTFVKGTQGQVGVLAPMEGMWEFTRGQKVDGGERRQAEVRSKRRSAERRAARV